MTNKTFLAVVPLCIPLCAAAFEKSANDMLATAYRSDLVGAEVWTAESQSKDLKGTGESYLESEVPFFLNPRPEPGLSGRLHVVHETPVSDALTPVVSECRGDAKEIVGFTAVRNSWTPAHCTTYYRSLPGAAAAPGEYGLVGDTVLKETKCIDSDNVFVAEAVIKNAGMKEREYIVSIVPARAFGRIVISNSVGSAVWNFKTVSMCKTRPRRCSVAFGTSFGGFSKRVKVPARGEFVFRYACAFSAQTPWETEALLAKKISAADPFGDNEKSFNAWFAAKTPRFESSDAGTEKMYFYRWFVVKRNTHDARRVIADHEYPRTAVYESPVGDWFNCVIGLPVPLQLQEMAWMRDPSAARDHLLNWCDAVRGYRMYIQYTGMSAWAMLRNHPDADFAKRISGVLAKDAFKRARGDSGTLPVQTGSWTTGAEYQPNFYQFTEPEWDYRHDEQFVAKGFSYAKLVRLDTAMYAIGSLAGASKVAAMAGDGPLSLSCMRAAEAKLATIRENHWSEKLGLFLSADPKSGALADRAACYDSFAPYLWGLVGEARFDRAFDKLTDRAWFWDDFPVTTAAKTCPMYFGANAVPVYSDGVCTNFWRYGCSWNGPAWHYANTLVAEAFGRAAVRTASRRAKWLEFFKGWTDLHYPYADRSMPRAAEHVRPEDGALCGGAWDYFHSAWIDPMIRYWCGISIDDALGEITFDPFTSESFRLAGVPLGGEEYTFEQRLVDGVPTRTVLSSSGEVLARSSGVVTVRRKSGASGK